ncbi:MAG: putative Ig domain-containing protein [Candidatus Thiodiazotropha sp.]|jgi:hypothetical protein
MKSYFKILPLLAITLILSACGGTDTPTGDTAGNPSNDVTTPDITTSNQPPQIDGTPSAVATVGMVYSFTPNASDPDGDSLSFTATGLPSWASLDVTTGTLSGTPGSSDVGLTGEIVLTVSDGSDQSSLAPFSISVEGDTSQKVVSARIVSGMDDVEEQADSAMYVDSSDLELINDGDDQLVGLRFSLPVPKDAVITQANLRFTTDETSTAETDLVIWAQASDDAEPFTTSSGNISSRAATIANVIWKPQGWSNVGESGVAQTTSDLSSVIQEVVQRSGWNSNNHLVLVVSGQGSRTAESYEGSSSNAALLTVSYTANETGGSNGGNQTPSISGVPDTGATVGYTYVFTPIASDPEMDLLTFSIVNKPAWASFDAQSGTLSGTPAATDAGSYGNIGISVSDGESSATLAPFTIVVSSDNRSPTISGTPVANVVELSTYSFTPTASDPDGDSISFSITNKPSWAVFDAATGNLSGTPGYADAGTYSNIVISVSDGSVSASLPPFAITVADLNRAPVISGTAASSVDEGSAYSFTPSASDVDGDSLTYSISNQPAWTSFNTATGRLSGTPDYDSAGSYGNIVISVTDGAATASLAPFTITVADVNQAPVISGSPTLSVTAGSAYSFTPNASDGDSDSLSFSVNNLPSWASFDSATGRVSGTPQESDVGVYSNIQIAVSDGSDTTSLSAFSITVNTSTVVLGSISLDWTPPATRTDATVLDVSEIGGYVVYLGTSVDSLQEVVDITDSSITTYTIDELEPGTYYVALKIYDVDGNFSGLSNTVSIEVTN